MVKKISTLDIVHRRLFNNYVVKIATPPFGTSYRLMPWDSDERTIDVPRTSGSIWFWVFLNGDPIHIATATFAADDLVVRCDAIHVAKLHRRKGIATKLYRLASSIFQAKIVPSDVLQEDGIRFWRGRSAIYSWSAGWAEGRRIFYGFGFLALLRWFASTFVRNP